MSLLRADKIANRFNNSGPIIVGPSTVSGNFTVTGILTALGIGVTNNVLVGGGLTAKFITATNSASLFNSSLTGITTAGIITGATYFGDGVNLTGIVTEIQPGPGIQISPISGKGKLTISANGVVVSGYSTNSGLATDVKGGVAGAVLYQVGPNDTGFTASGTTGEILQSQGTASPIWTSLAAINVSYADSAGISTNLKGGSAGRIPYQSGQNQTAFLPIGPTGNLLLGQGTAAPSWIDPKANLDVRYARLSGISTSAIGGVVDTNSLIVSGITTLTGGNVVVDNDLRVSGVTTAANMVVTGVSTIATLKVGTGAGATVGVTTILDEDTFASNSNEALATQQSIKAYVDNAAGNVSLEYGGNIGTSSIDLDGERFDILGKVSEIYTVGTGLTITVGLDTNVTIPNNLVVSGFSSLSGLTTITGNLGVTGLTSTQFLTVSGVGTIQTLGVTGVTTTQFLEVTGVGTIGTLGVSGVTTTSTLGVSGVTTTQFLEVTGVSTIATLGVTGVTTTQSLQVIGVTTTGTLLVGGSVSTPGSTDYSSVTLSGLTPSSFNTTYVRQTTGFVLDNGAVASGSAQFHADSNYYYYIAASGSNPNGRVLIYSELDSSWVVFFDTSGNFSEGNVSENDTIGSGNVFNDLVTSSSTTADGRNVPQASSDIVYATSGGGSTAGIGVTITTDGNAIFSGIVTASTLNVTGTSTLGFTTITDDLYVSGVSTVGFLTVTDSLYVSGIASVGAAVTMYGNTGIVSATAFYGDGSNLTGVVGLVSVTNQIYVTPDGNDENDGYLISTAKRTVGSALTIAEASSVIRISAGNYSENNPIILPEQVTLLGDSLREVSIIPQNPDEDLIYVANGSYVENMTFTGTLNEGKAIIAFNPNKPSYVTQGPYIRNCTNFISNSIGMKIDGRHVIGDTRAMNVDSYTQLNQGGIGVSVSNEGYAQLVSIFTIYNDQSIVCIDGGQCDLTNSNSSFGRLGLVADGIGPTNFIGTITEFTSAGSNVFPIDIGVDSVNVTNATYDNVTGLTTITTATNHDFNVGMSVSMRNLKFSCDSKDVVREVSTAQQVPFSVSAATYTQSTGIMTVTTSAAHNFNRRSAIDLNQLVFQCNSGGGPSTAFFPPAGGDGNGPSTSRFIVEEIPANNQFVVDVGISTIVHTYVDGGTSTLRPSQFGITTASYTASTGIMTVTTNSDHNLNYKTAVNLNNLVFRCNSGGGFSTAFFPPAAGDGNGATTSRFSVQEIPDDNQFVVNVGISTIAHEYVEGGTTTNTPYYGITTATYNNITGVMTISTDVEHNVVAGISVTMTDLVFRCDSGGGPSTAFFPPASGDNNGAPTHVFDVISVGATNITVNVGPSTIAHSYIDGGQVAISTISSFPNGSFGNIFTVDSVTSPTQFTSYVGVSTYPSLYHSGGQVETFTSLPYDGQVVYLDSIYNTIKGVKITSGGSGYTTPPTVTFSDPSESWGIKATGVARLTGGSVTSVDMISNGRGYTGTPTVSFTGSATGTPDVLPTYYVVSSATPVVGGITTVTFTENVPYAVGVGTTVPFFKQSRVLASSQAFEYIGSGNTALTALPQRGGIAIPENEIVNKNGGLVIFTSTDQAGNFKIGEGVIINQLEGSITGDAYNRSLFANITPYILALGGDS